MQELDRSRQKRKSSPIIQAVTRTSAGSGESQRGTFRNVRIRLPELAQVTGELGQPNADIAERAALRLAAAGRRAGDRLDYRAALALLSRAVELLHPIRLDLALELEAAWYMLSVDGRAAAEAAEAVAGRAEGASDRSGAMLARATALLSTRLRRRPCGRHR